MKYIYLLFTILSLQLSSCQNKEAMKKDVFEWQETTSCPPGYAVDVYQGGLHSSKGFTSLYLGVDTGKEGWGRGASGMSSGKKTLPNHLHVIWVSYFEHKFYEIDTPIDYNKMVDLFNEGYYLVSDNPDNPRLKWENYDSIIVGFAPGGVVVIWIAGLGRQIEIGRYQGKEITFSKEYVESLHPGTQKNKHDITYHNKILYEWNMIPKEIVEEIKDKPIPYGLWDTYRKKYNWQLKFVFLHNEKIKNVTYYLLNGEEEELYGEVETEKYPKIPVFFRWETRKARAIPKTISFFWEIDSSVYSCYIELDEKEIMTAFERVLGNDPGAEVTIELYVNTDRTRATVSLKTKEEEVGVFNNKVTINKR